MISFRGDRAQVIQVTAEERRRDRAADLDLRREERQLEREARQEKQQQRMQRRFARQQTRAKLSARISAAVPRAGQRLLIIGPITAPMSVAWVGQIDFALHTLGWWLVFAVVFAAAWEATTTFAGWMYHQARASGDRGLQFRLATWFFAGSAGAMNYWHASPTVSKAGRTIVLLDPTPKAVSYGAMSLVGIAVWELYASLIHRRKLRADGKLPPARPRFGVARWVRYPGLTWTAWSLTIRHQIPTSDQAWSLAVSRRDSDRPTSLGPVVDQPPVRVVVGRTTVIRDRSFTRPGDSARRTVLTTPFGGFALTGPTRPNGQQRPPERAPASAANDHSGDRPNDQRATTTKTSSDQSATTARKQPTRTPAKRRSSRPTPDENRRATARYIESCQAGAPLSERDLAREFGRSKGWARDRIQEAGPQPVVGQKRPPASAGGRPPAESANDHLNDHPSDHEAVNQ